MRPFLSLFFFLLFAAATIPAEARQVFNFNTGWRFTKGNPANAQATDFNDANWESVRLPHDWAIAGPADPLGDPGTGKLPWKGEGWYRKTFTLDAALNGQQIYFLFDGIMAFPEVYINGKPAGKWDYGYNSFYLNVSELINYGGSNVMAIYVDTRQHESRWYPGAGIYRKIEMIATAPVHVGIWGTFVSTPEVRDQWTKVRVLTEVLNGAEAGEQVEIVTEILSPENRVIASGTETRLVEKGGQKTFESWFTLTRPQRWDVDNPVLYAVRTAIKKNGRETDVYVTPFGIREIRFTANDGMYLNGRRLQLKGVCLHHDHGPLGAKFYPRAMERQIEIMKNMGVNAIRTSHNMPAPELLDLCDKMGILVFDEAYDKWDRKADLLPGADFYESAERNIRNFIKRDRNHPSVFIWSVGNEMADVQNNTNDGLQKLAAITGYVRQYDPTRPLTAVCDNMEGVKWRHFDYYDVHNWNYGRRYRPAREMEPGKAVIISESASTVSTRGFYELPLPGKKTDFTQSLQVSSYDLHAPDWAEIADDDFKWQEEDRYVAGEFVWTGFDYLGEPTPYDSYRKELTPAQTAKSSYFGAVDLCGIPKDRFYLYKSYWLPDTATVHLLPHWNWAGMEGQKIPVFVYTNGDCAELFLNGKSLGKKYKNPLSPKSTERYRLMWEDIVYEHGTLEAVAFKEGDLVGAAKVVTAKAPYALKLSPDRSVLKPGGADLSYVLVEAVDKAGNPCPLADLPVQFKVEGPGSIEGVGNGNPQSLEPFMADSIRLFYGKAMLIVRSDEIKKGGITVTASGEGVKGAEVRLEVRE